MTNESCVLYVVPTPLGNLSDMSQRSIDILRTVPWVAAEDTRHSAPLLKHFGSPARLLPAHQHNENEAATRIIEIIQNGASVALVSDAGTPGISDPGARIVAAVRNAGFPIIPLPGPCAATTAMSASGLSDEHFLFYGFLPSKSGQRKQALASISTSPFALVFYEAPHRVLETIDEMVDCLGQRTLVIARELTKLFESIHRLPLSEAREWLEADPNRLRGEFVLIVSGAVGQHEDAEGIRVLKVLLGDGLPVKQAAKLAASISGYSKNKLYDFAISLKKIV
jgi:16S rRNA (cytidine1402-2'-O)-methyltransferase